MENQVNRNINTAITGTFKILALPRGDPISMPRFFAGFDLVYTGQSPSKSELTCYPQRWWFTPGKWTFPQKFINPVQNKVIYYLCCRLLHCCNTSLFWVFKPPQGLFLFGRICNGSKRGDLNWREKWQDDDLGWVGGMTKIHEVIVDDWWESDLSYFRFLVNKSLKGQALFWQELHQIDG